MRVGEIMTLYDYNSWANDRILSAATALTAEQFVAPTQFPHRSVRGTLRHILAGERLWLDRWQERPLRPVPGEEEFADVTMLQARWSQEEAELRAYLATLEDADLEQHITVAFPRLEIAFTAARWTFMVHLVNHGTQTRSEVAQMLTEYGHSPGDIDLLLILPSMKI
jgi:uncharacterized damage-inducible protein DinB